MGRQLAFQPVEIEIRMKIGQDRVLRAKMVDPSECFGDREMARMRRVAQGIDNPEVEVLQEMSALRRDRVEVRRISHAAEAKAERVDFAMLEPERNEFDVAARTRNGAGFAGNEAPLGQERRIKTAFRRLENIAEMAAH